MKRPSVAREATEAELLTPSLNLWRVLMREVGVQMPPLAAGLILSVAVEGGRTQAQLAENLGASQFALSRACKALKQHRLIRVEAVGRENRIYLDERGEAIKRKAVAELRASVRRVRAAVDQRALENNQTNGKCA